MDTCWYPSIQEPETLINCDYSCKAGILELIWLGPAKMQQTWIFLYRSYQLATRNILCNKWRIQVHRFTFDSFHKFQDIYHIQMIAGDLTNNIRKLLPYTGTSATPPCTLLTQPLFLTPKLWVLESEFETHWWKSTFLKWQFLYSKCSGMYDIL